MDAKSTKVNLIQSDDAEPLVRLKQGKRYDVVATTVVDHELSPVDERKPKAARLARLCGSHSTCVAIVEVDL